MVQAASTGVSSTVDHGLRVYMQKVYGLMSAAMILTAVVAFLVGHSPDAMQLIYGTHLKWIVMLAPLGVVILFAARIHKMSLQTAHMVFWLFAALVGVSISYIFVAYTGYSIVRTFFVTACAFLGLSLYGYTTKRDLSGIGTFLVMGLIGLIVASLINLWLQSGALHFAISVIGVLIFAGLTACDTQRVKKTYLVIRDHGAVVQGRQAIMGALSLYLDFLNMFMFLLQFLGMARE